jgi:starvation-inducible DNA-binding protein
MILYSLHKKHHWQLAGPTLELLHLLLDKHACEQLELIEGAMIMYERSWYD